MFNIGDEVEVQTAGLFVPMALVKDYVQNKNGSISRYDIEVVIWDEDNPCRRYISVSPDWVFKYERPQRVQKRYTTFEI